MKTVILFLSIVSKSFAFDSFPISDMLPVQDRYGVVNLITYPQMELTLDCSSFLHGLSAKSANHSSFLMLYESECHHIFNSLFTWFLEGKQACLKVDFKQKDWVLEKTNRGCL